MTAVKVSVPRERWPQENRVAATPHTVQKMKALGFQVFVEKGAGEGAHFPDAAYEAAGAYMCETLDVLYQGTELVLKVRPLTEEEKPHLPPKVHMVGMLGRHTETYKDFTAFNLELLPRVTRAQALDVLSSQNNLAGYRAVVALAASMQKVLPMMTTAAGLVVPANVLILGAGVAGLQAIATAKRLGAQVWAFDVREETKEQIQSLGARFISVVSEEDAADGGGYAKEMSTDYQKRQREAILALLPKMDGIVTTALIPGKKAPVLLTEDMLHVMKAGSVIVDLAAETGGNCAVTQPGKSIQHQGVQVMGYTGLLGSIAQDASSLYAMNIWHFIQLLWDQTAGTFKDPKIDELLEATCLTF